MGAALEIILTEGASQMSGGGGASPAPPMQGAPGAIVPYGQGRAGESSHTSDGMVSLSAILGDRLRELIELSPHVRAFSAVLARGVSDLNAAIAITTARSHGTAPLALPPSPSRAIAIPPTPTGPATNITIPPTQPGQGDAPADAPAATSPAPAAAPADGAEGASASGLSRLTVIAGASAIAIGGLAAAAVGVTKAFSMLGDAGRAETERLSGYSGEMANATAMAQVADMARDMKRADQLGPQFAAFTAASSRLENAISDMKNAFLEKTLPVMTLAIDRVAESIKIAEQWQKELEIWFDKQRGDHAEARKDQQDLQRIMQELADIQKGLPPGGDDVANVLMAMAADKANNPFGAPRRLPARRIP